MTSEFPARPFSALCAKCQVVVDDRKTPATPFGLGRADDYKKYDHHIDWTSLQRSADGCGLCSQFIQASDGPREWDPQELWAEPSSGIVLFDHASNYELFIPHHSGGPAAVESEGIRPRLFVHSTVRIEPARYMLVDYDSPEPDTSTKDALPLCRLWLRSCISKHEGCLSKRTQSLPTRLIDIAEGGPRLRLAEEVAIHAKYVTLSHCWGNLKFPTLTSASLDEFRKTIPAESLPKTFRDAISIARDLGFTYIWIDSLCIIQDSLEDWERESVSMSGIYECAMLNIAATDAKDASVGCYHKREKNWRCRVLDSEEKRPYDCYPSTALDLPSNPLGRRAWVLQERYLSPRVLHFAASQVFWECRERSACEIYPIEYLNWTDVGQTGRVVLVPTTDVGFQQLEKMPRIGLTYWRKLVQLYSARMLTRVTDKLVAISGLAAQVGEETKYEYAAGLWRAQMEDHLLWYVPDEVRGVRNRNVPYTAPTWSWASLDSQIRFALSDRDWFGWADGAERCIDVVDVAIQLGTTGSFGSVTGGSLRARCTHFYYGSIVGGWRERSESRHRTPMHVRFGGGTLWFGDTARDATRSVYSHFDWLDPAPETRSMQLFVLVLRLGCARRMPTYGLFLQGTGKKQGQYERLGMFMAERSDEFREAIEGNNYVVRGRTEFFLEQSELGDGETGCFIELV